MAPSLQEAIAAAVLLAVLVFAVVRPRRLPEAVAAVPGALLVVGLGIVSPAEAYHRLSAMASTVVFLGAVLMLAELCRREGLFAAAGRAVAKGARGDTTRLLGLVFLLASLTTAVLSLDATVVLLTPVVFATARRLGVKPKPYTYATTHLANSASSLMPVSNLTNLLAVGATGLSFMRFVGVMALPWVVAIGIEYVVFRLFFARELAEPGTAPGAGEAARWPWTSVVVLALVLVGFVVSSPLHVQPFWSALAGVVVLTGKRMVRTKRAAREVAVLVRAANAWFLAFVMALAVVVDAVVRHGLAGALAGFVPQHQGPWALVGLTVVAGVLANLVNNLPAVLILLPLVAPMGPLPVLAVLLGVNVGPNLTYLGSLATLLWRHIMVAHHQRVSTAEFTRLGLLTVPVSLLLCPLALWVSGRLLGL